MPGSVVVEATASAQTFVPRASLPSTNTAGASSSTAPTFLPASDVRISYDTMVIQQVASQLQLPEHPENDLLLMHKRPRVPLLSKSYVNKSNLVHVGVHTEENSAITVPNTQNTAPIALTKRARAVQKPADGSDNESDGYGEDDDFEPTDNTKAVTGADAVLVQKVLHNERYSTPHRAHSEAESDGESDGDSAHHHARSSEVDLITKKSELRSQKRREVGKEYAQRKRYEAHQKEEEARRAKALQEEKRKQALAMLQTHVVSINKRSKHTPSGAAPSNGSSSVGTHTVQSTSNITSAASTPATLRGMTGSANPTPTFEEAPEENDEANRPALASIKEYVMNKYDFLPRQLLSADDVDSINYNDGNSEYVDSAPISRPQSRLVETPQADDLRNLDPREAGGWNQFLAQERRLIRAAELEIANRERARESSRETKDDTEHRGNKDKTPPRTRSSNGVSAPSSSQSHGQQRRSSPQSVRPERTSPATSATLHATAAMTAAQARRPTPPPFRFNSWQAPTAASASKRLAGDRNSSSGVQTRPATAGQTVSSQARSSSAGRSRPQSGPSKQTSAKKTKMIQPPEHKTSHRKSLPPRSSSAGSNGMVRRRSQGDAVPKSRYTKPVTRSRSVLHQGSREEPAHLHARGGDTLDLFDRYHSSDDEPNFYDEAPGYEGFEDYDNQEEYVQDDHPVEQMHDAPAHNGLGGYLSRSPARGLLPEADQYRSQHDLEAALHVPRLDGIAARSLEEAQLMQDVSFQAIKNFEQVTRVLQDVDRWCERAKHDTLELQEKLRLRESCESLAGLYPRAASDLIPDLPDQRDIDVIRSSLVGRLASAPGLFDAAVGDSSEDSNQSHSQSESQDSLNESADSASSRSKYSYELSEEERQQAGDSDHSESNESEGEEPLSVHDSWNKRLPPAPFQEMDQFGLDEHKHTDDTEDTVLMASDDEQYDHDETGSDLEEPQLQALSSSAANPSRQSGPSDLVLLNTSNPDRPIIWAPAAAMSKSADITGPAHRSVAEFATKDPLMTHQLGMMADCNEIFAKFANIKVSDLDSPAVSADFTQQRYPVQKEEEDWSKPFVRPAPSATIATKSAEPAYLPSLRNVGELAGLLRSTYRLDISTETGRAAVLERSSSDSGSDSETDADDSVIGEDYDNFSAVSIFASKMMQQQAQQLAAKEAALIRAPSAVTPVAVDVSTNTSVVDNASRAAPAGARSSDLDAAELEHEDSFYSAEAIAKRLARLDDSSASALDLAGPDIPTDEMLHDYIMTARFGVDNAAIDEVRKSFTGGMPTAGSTAKTDAEAGASQKVRFSGAEMRMRMMDELRRQDELFNYTLELAELEKTNALQSARDLAMQAQQRSEKEFAHVKQQQELDLQRLAYENALALSLVNAQAAMDKHAAEQREQMGQLESQVAAQEMFRQYQDLLRQADHVAGSLEHNQQLLLLEKLMSEESAREAAAQQESKHIAERAALVLAHAEAQQAQALTLAAASRSSWQAAEASHAQAAQTHAQAQALAKAQMQALSQIQAQAQHPPKHKGTAHSPNRSSRGRLDESTSSAAARYAQDSFDDDEEDYSTQFETEASMSMVSKHSKSVGNKKHVSAQDDSYDSIPDDESMDAPVEQHSLSMSDSVHDSPAVKLNRTGHQKRFQHAQLQESTQSIQSEKSASRSQPRATGSGRVTGATDFDMESSDDSVEEDIPDDNMDETGEVTEESGRSVFESYQDSPVKASINRGKAAMSASRVSTDLGASASQSYSRSGLEISERSVRAPVPSQQARRFHASQQSDDFEVEEDDSQHDGGSIADEIEEEDAVRRGSFDADEVEEEGDEYADEKYDDYSDTFEASDSKGSRSSSLSSKKPLPARQSVSNAQRTAPDPAAKQSAAPRNYADPSRTSIPAYLDSSLDHGDVLPHHQDVTAVLDEYRNEMDQRLRAQEKTYTLKVQFLRAKQAQRLEWLDKVRQNKKIKASDIAEEEQRIRDTYAEERAECERERWALNARSYKELRKFKRLRKELVSYQINMENSTEAAAEFETALLDLKNRRSDLRASREARRFDLRESSDSVGSSSDSNVKFGQFKKLGTAKEAPNVSSTPQKGAVAAVHSQPDDSYADEFEQTFSTSASPTKPQVPPAAKKFATSYSEVYDDEMHSENEEEKEIDDEVLQGSVASEIPEEADEASFNDSIEDAPYVSQRDQDDSYHASSPTGARETYEGAEFESHQASKQQEYSAEEFESTNIESSYKSAALSPVPQQKLGSSSVPTPQQESSSSGSYEEDFVQESHESDESKSATASPVPAVAARAAAIAAVGVASKVQDNDSSSEVSEVEDEIEEDDELQQAHLSQGSEEYRPDSSLSHSPEQDQQAEKESEQSDGSDEFDQDVDRTGSAFNSPDKTANLSHHSDSASERSQDSPGGDHLQSAKLSTSVHSLGSRSASQQEDQDEVNLGEEDGEEDDYASEFDSEPEKDDQVDASASASASASAQSSPVKSTPTPTPTIQQKSPTPDDASEVDEDLASIATEEEEPQDERDAHSDSDSELSVQHTDSTSASPVKVDTSATKPTGKEDIVKISPATTFSPMRSDRSEGYVGSDDPDVEVWGSEDFAESPSAFSRKTSDLMMQQLSSESMFGASPQGPGINNMVFDPEQQRWVGGEDVSLDGFDESIGPADNDNDSSSHGWRKNDDSRPDLIRGTSSESRRSRTDSIEEVDESSFSEDEEDPVSSHSTRSAQSAQSTGQGQSVASRMLSRNQPTAHLGIAMSAASPFESAATSASNSPLAGGKIQKNIEAESVQAAEDPEVEDYGSDFSDEEVDSKLASKVEIHKKPVAQDAADDSASEIESDIEEDIASEASDASEDSEAELNVMSSPVKTAPAQIAEVEPPEADGANVTMLSVVSAADNSDIQSASQLSALLDSAQAAALDQVDHKLAADELLISGQDTAEGSLDDLSFDYVEPLGAENKNPATKAVAKQAAADDSFLDDLDFGSDDEEAEESRLGITSEATMEADLSDFTADYVEAVKPVVSTKQSELVFAQLDDSEIHLPDYSEDIEEIPELNESTESDPEELVVVSTPEMTLQAQEEKKQNEQEEQRLVLVEEVTDHLLDVLVQQETQRVLDLVSQSMPTSRRQTPVVEVEVKYAPAKDDKTVEDFKTEETKRADAKDSSADVDEGEESEQSADLDLLAETLTLSSARFAPKVKDEVAAADESRSSASSLPPLTSMSSMASLSALPSLGGKPRFTPSLASTEDENEAEDEGDYSIKALVPAEFDDEDLYEFDIPSNANTPTVLSLASTDKGSAESEENQASAALATALAAAERRQAQCVQMVTETKVRFVFLVAL